MKIIPVIDLMHGEVVHAQFGQRQNYLPIKSHLCNSSLPIDVVNAFMELYPFTRLYIADLDAITGHGQHISTISQLRTQYPTLEIWLDAGIKTAAELTNWSALNVTHVIGSENISSMEDLKQISQTLHGNFVLSLDFNQTGFLGHPELQVQTECWPAQLIVMTLSRVGSQNGVDVDRLQSVKTLAKGRQVYAAGGIRNNDDFHILHNNKITGALVATALHNNHLNLKTIYRPLNELRRQNPLVIDGAVRTDA